MQITEVKVFPVEEEKLKAFVSIVFDGCFMVNDIKVIRGKEGLFISMPSRRKKNGKFKDVAHPLNNETRRMIEDQILAQYREALGERAAETPTDARKLPSEGAAAQSQATPAPRARERTREPARQQPRERAPERPREGTREPVAAAAAEKPPAAVAAEKPAEVAAEPARTEEATAQEPAAVESAPAQPEEAAPEAAEPPDEKSLEEVTEIHLRDSFWST